MSFNHTHIFGTKNGVFEIIDKESQYITITDSDFTCVEDEISMDITNTVFTGIVIKNFTIIATFLFLVIIQGRIRKKPEKSWKK